MLLGFKKRFAPIVEEGSKTHTIRAKRKIRPRVGEICHCYTGLRQKGARLLGRWECVKVEPINIYECGDGRFSVWVGENELTPDEKDALAWRDGFRDQENAPFVQMMQYWINTHGDGKRILVTRVNYPAGEPVKGYGKPLDFEGDLIHWRYSS